MSHLPPLASIILLASVAGFASSMLGGLIALFISPPGKKFIGITFIFTASILLTLVFVDFIPHAIGHGHYHINIDPMTGAMYQYWHQHHGAGIELTVVGLLIGIALIMTLNHFDRYGHEHIHGVLPHNADCSHDELSKAEKKRVRAIAFPVALAIILHDFPKGLAIGSAGSVFAALLIGLSCIPEGMTIAMPLKAGGVKAWKILSVCGIAGAATVAGAVVGYLIGGINVYISGMMFAIAAGCILGVVFSELMPLAMEYAGRTRWKLPVMIVAVALVVLLDHFLHHLMH